jgi:hypothetical protein
MGLAKLERRVGASAPWRRLSWPLATWQARIRLFCKEMITWQAL